MTDAALSVCSTWGKRGHSSGISIVFILLTDTGEAMDYVIRSLVFHMFSANNK